MNLFDYHDCGDFSIFKTENRILFEMLSCSQDKTVMRKLLEEKRNQYKNIDGATIRTIFDIIGIKYNSKIRAKIEEEEDMCKAWDEMMEDERQAGREDGLRAAVSMCKSMEVSLQNTIENIAKAFSISMEIADRKVRMYW